MEFFKYILSRSLQMLRCSFSSVRHGLRNLAPKLAMLRIRRDTFLFDIRLCFLRTNIQLEGVPFRPRISQIGVKFHRPFEPLLWDATAAITRGSSGQRFMASALLDFCSTRGDIVMFSANNSPDEGHYSSIT